MAVCWEIRDPARYLARAANSPGLPEPAELFKEAREPLSFRFRDIPGASTRLRGSSTPPPLRHPQSRSCHLLADVQPGINKDSRRWYLHNCIRFGEGEKGIIWPLCRCARACGDSLCERRKKRGGKRVYSLPRGMKTEVQLPLRLDLQRRGYL